MKTKPLLPITCLVLFFTSCQMGKFYATKRISHGSTIQLANEIQEPMEPKTNVYQSISNEISKPHVASTNLNPNPTTCAIKLIPNGPVMSLPTQKKTPPPIQQVFSQTIKANNRYVLHGGETDEPSKSSQKILVSGIMAFIFGLLGIFPVAIVLGLICLHANKKGNTKKELKQIKRGRTLGIIGLIAGFIWGVALVTMALYGLYTIITLILLF